MWCWGVLEAEASPEGSDVAGLLRIELKRLSEKPLLALEGDGVRTGSEGMPESVCGRGRRCCSALGLRVVLVEGRLSRKLWMEPLRWREDAAEAEEKEESLLRLFWRVKVPAKLPRARERALSPCWGWSPSVTASSCMP